MGLSVGQSSLLGKPITLKDTQESKSLSKIQRGRQRDPERERDSLKDFLQLLCLRVSLKHWSVGDKRPKREAQQTSCWNAISTCDNRWEGLLTFVKWRSENDTHGRLTSGGRAPRRCSQRSTCPPWTCRRSSAAPQELGTTASPPERRQRGRRW